VVGGSQLIGDQKVYHASCKGSIAGDPFPSSVAGALTSLATVNGVAPSGGPASLPRSTCDLGV
jgi:hypothetical protein